MEKHRIYQLIDSISYCHYAW